MRVGVLFVAFLVSHWLIAQDQRCGAKVPSTGEFENWMELKIEEKLSRYRQKAPEAIVYQIPVVVHIFHKGETIGTGTNLSYERIQAQIDTLNADFRRLNEDAVNTPADFLSVAADSKIEFVLARQDPAGNPTNGIVRVHGEQNTYRVNSDKIQLRTESFWPPENYMNIYVADLRTFIGYAAFPVTTLDGIINENDDFILDAVYVDYEYFGNNPSAPAFESRGRTLAHEIGHFLGLRHIWGDSNCSGDDFVEDTPTARFDHSGTTSPCTYPIPDNLSTTAYDDGNTCTDEDDPDLPDMFQNYMDYTDDICMNLFTLGQKDRMRIVLENSPRRNSLLTSPALVEPARFTNDLAMVQIIAPNFAECGDQISPTLEVVNHGTNEISSFEIQLQIEGNPVGTPVTVNTTLQPFE
ncbi:MAG: zinc metalloprotease, partial [Bacteroidota bacterium]